MNPARVRRYSRCRRPVHPRCWSIPASRGLAMPPVGPASPTATNSPSPPSTTAFLGWTLRGNYASLTRSTALILTVASWSASPRLRDSAQLWM
ncbi:hypothetical protein MMEU_0990 [Mycobacterium marinum str. Europe]|nr:hypothetical protein MMEU_0990 [Mycobacterium marinum str. Europe]